MLFRQSVLTACAVAACSGTPAPISTPPRAERPAEEAAAPLPLAAPSVSGTYLNTHTIRVVCQNSDWCEEEVDDVMRIREEKGGIRLSLELVQANAHTCTFENFLMEGSAPESTRRWRFHNEPGQDDCDLTLEQKDGSFNIDSEGCRVYCGARAHLLATFRDRPHDPDPEAYDCAARCETVSMCTIDEQSAKSEDTRCLTACYKREGDARARWDECVRRAGKDCVAISGCSQDS